MGEAKRRQDGKIIEVNPPPADVKFRIIIEHLYDGRTRVEAPMNSKPLCDAMLQDGANVISFYSPQTEGEAKAARVIATSAYPTIQIPVIGPNGGKII